MCVHPLSCYYLSLIQSFVIYRLYLNILVQIKYVLLIIYIHYYKRLHLKIIFYFSFYHQIFQLILYHFFILNPCLSIIIRPFSLLYFDLSRHNWWFSPNFIITNLMMHDHMIIIHYKLHVFENDLELSLITVMEHIL